ncbi:ABC transporter permease [Actinomadura madurae]|uniref:ABC transporter permease n=1 Tax=Actinomadura madurae TaxID=1993 RepID=UPI0035573B98
MVAIALAATIVLTRRTALGMLLESVGGNAEASRLVGIRSAGLITLAYVFCGLCAGIAGLMISSNTLSADANHAGLWIELDAILAVVLGGTALTGGRFSLAGTIVGALIIQTLDTTIYTAGIPPRTTLVFEAVVVTIVCLLQSPAFRAKIMRRGPGGGRAAAPAPANAEQEVTA